MLARSFLPITIFVLLCAFCYGIQFIPERIEVKYVDKTYISSLKVNVRRASRRGPYVANVDSTIVYPVGNNITLYLHLFEYRSKYNQFVPTPMELHYKICDLYYHDKLLGPIIQRKFNVKECPFPVGPFFASNVTFSGKLPFEISFDKGKVEMTLRLTASGLKISTVDVMVNIKK